MTTEPKFVPQPTKPIWSLWDLLLVGFVVLLAVAAALMALRQYQHQQALGRVVEELRSATLAFGDYMQQHVKVPEAANFGEAPKSEAPFLAQLKWGEPTPIGGYYRWLGGPEKKPTLGGVTSGRIGIAAFPPAPSLSLSGADWREIDQRIDDGNLSTGNFRLGFNGWPILTVHANP